MRSIVERLTKNTLKAGSSKSADKLAAHQTEARFSGSILINVHKEGLLLCATILNCLKLKALAAQQNHDLEIIIVADSADETTLQVVEYFSKEIHQFHMVNYRDAGKSRGFGIDKAKSDIIFFHDGDDLYSENYYIEALNLVNSDKFERRSFYHCEYRVDFDQEIRLTRNISSDDPRFDPQLLVGQWYFSFKGFAHRSLFEEFPIPDFDSENGIVGEDWTWASNMINAGAKHQLLFDTIVFYRRKRREMSLGMLSGVIHGRSPLFDPANVRADSARRSSRVGEVNHFLAAQTPEPIDFLSRTFVREGLLAKIRALIPVEPLLSDVVERIGDPVNPLQLASPDFPYGVATCYRHICEKLDDRPKVILFVGPNRLPGKNLTFEKIVADCASDPTRQTIVVLDRHDLIIDTDALERIYSVTILNFEELITSLHVKPHVHNWILMRILLQTRVEAIYNFSSERFTKLAIEFKKVFRSLKTQVYSIILSKCPGIYDPDVLALRTLVICFDDVGCAQWHHGFLAGGEIQEALEISGLNVRPLNEQTLSALHSLLQHRGDLNETRYRERVNAFKLLPPIEQKRVSPPAAQGEIYRIHVGTGQIDLNAPRRLAGFTIASAGDGWASATTLAKLRRKLLESIDISIVLPQYVIYETGRTAQILWLDSNAPERHVLGLLDEDILHGPVPMVALLRRNMRTESLIGSQDEWTTLSFRTLFRVIAKEMAAKRVAVVEDTAVFRKA